MWQAATPREKIIFLHISGAVLLKNTWGVGGIPLSRASTRTLALIGPNGNNSRGQLCSYYNEYGPCGGWDAVVTPLSAFTEAVPTVLFAKGCFDTFCNNASLFPDAVAGESFTASQQWPPVIHVLSCLASVYAAASSADVTVVAGGIDYNNAQVGRSLAGALASDRPAANGVCACVGRRGSFRHHGSRHARRTHIKCMCCCSSSCGTVHSLAHDRLLT